MCIYFLLLSWALVLLFEVGYLHFPPESNVPGKENQSLSFEAASPGTHWAGEGQGEGQQQKCHVPFPKAPVCCALEYLCKTQLRR